MIRKPVPGQMYGVADVPFVDEEFSAEFPTLKDYLFMTRWQDGSLRQTSTLLVFSDGTALKLVLNDRDNNRSVFVNDSCFFSAIKKLEVMLRDDTADWKSRSGGQQDKMRTPF